MINIIVSLVGQECLNVDREINSYMSRLEPNFDISNLTPKIEEKIGLYKDFKTIVHELVYTIDLTSENKKFNIKKSVAWKKDDHYEMDTPLYVDVEFDLEEQSGSRE